MKVVSKFSKAPVVAAAVLALTLPLGAATTSPGASVLLRLTSKTSGGLHATLSKGQTTTPFLRPVTACSKLASLGYDFSKVPDAPTVILSANQVIKRGGAPRSVTCMATSRRRSSSRSACLSRATPGSTCSRAVGRSAASRSPSLRSRAVTALALRTPR